MIDKLKQDTNLDKPQTRNLEEESHFDRVTVPSGLLRRVPDSVCFSIVITNNTLFYSQKCPGLDDDETQKD